MPIQPPRLDARSFDDLVEEVLARIPAHTPEWTNVRPGDPGRTLVELFAWLTDALLYRANQLPLRQRLTFLRLLGQPLRPALPARGLVSLLVDNSEFADAVTLQPRARIDQPSVFETRSEITVLPITAEVYAKRPLIPEEQRRYFDLVQGLKDIHGLPDAVGYVSVPVFPGGAARPGGFDVVQDTLDGALWLALLTLKDDPRPDFVQQIRAVLGGVGAAANRLLSVGVEPALAVPELMEDTGQRPPIAHTWEITSTPDGPLGRVDYVTVDPQPDTDTTAGLTRRGTVRLILPGVERIGAPDNDVFRLPDAGVGNRPPRLDDRRKAARLVAWLRLRPLDDVDSLQLSWVGVNAVEIEGLQTTRGRLVGQSDGSPDQELRLPGRNVDPGSLEIEVQDPQEGYQLWRRVDDLALLSREPRARDEPAYQLDSEAGTIRLGDNVRGRIPQEGMRVRIREMRTAGGAGGNLPPGLLTELASAYDLDGRPLAVRLKVHQPLPTGGGQDAETIEQAEKRIPSLFRTRDRAITADDYDTLARQTPGVRVGRVNVLPRFKPHDRMQGVPGVVSVMVWPEQPDTVPPNPRAGRPLLEAVHAYLDERRPLATELYVIRCEYVPLGLTVGVAIAPGFGRDAVLRAVRQALRGYLWPLVPGGLDGQGWELGRAVQDRELEVVIARVPGVRSLTQVNLFQRLGSDWTLIVPRAPGRPAELPLLPWQLPEVLTMVVDPEGNLPPDLSQAETPAGRPTRPGEPGQPGEEAPPVGVPVVPEVCG